LRTKGQRLSAEQHQRLWHLWRQGGTCAAIGAAIEVHGGTVYYIVTSRGGIPPRERTRAPGALCLSDREEISRGIVAGDSIRMIACQLGRSASTISREIRRNGGRVHYRAAAAEAMAWRRAERPKECRLACAPLLRRAVETKLRLDWSPQQIAEWLKERYPENPHMQVSHETIYRTLYVQARGGLKKELVTHLRRGRSVRRSRANNRRAQGRGQIPDAVSIADRPAQIEDRAVPGHWEGDLVAGTQRSHIATLVERHSRYVMLVRLPNRDTSTVVKALIRRVQRLPRGLVESLTWDRGLEMARHKEFTVATDVQVYFCDPRSPWQRGSNENTNGLLRQYFPKGMDLTNVTQRQLDAVAKKLNTRPRQTLNWKTPAEVLAAAVAATG
jgi:IS30 family transposase